MWSMQKELATASEKFECRAWIEWKDNEINMRSLLNLVCHRHHKRKRSDCSMRRRGRGSSGRLLRGNSYAKVKHKKNQRKP